MIDFFSVEDLAHIRDILARERKQSSVSGAQNAPTITTEETPAQPVIAEQRPEDDLYSVKGFSV